jgi:putative spermidine/putrescine transport system permease protein
MTAIAELDGAPAGVMPLKQQLARADRRRKLVALGLVAPLFLFISISFVLPIGQMLWRSFHDPDLTELLPRTKAALSDWSGPELPDEPVYAALAADLVDAQKAKTIALIGKRLNYEISGVRSKVISSGKEVAKLAAGPYKEALIDANAIWADRATWSILKRSTRPYTDFYLLNALDYVRDADGVIRDVPENEAIYVDVLLRTLMISATVTALTLLMGFPVAYLLANLPTGTSNLLMIMVLLPFWTSLLVRTTAWVVLLQGGGVVNGLLDWLGIIDQPLELIFNRGGTIVALTHIQLPFTLLPIYSVMRTISPASVRAARSLGAGPFYAFWRVYFPQTLPGVAAGCLLTFILCLGFYITPALVGGPTDQMVSYFVALYINREINWGMASALGAILLSATLILYLVYNRLIGIDKMKLG